MCGLINGKLNFYVRFDQRRAKLFRAFDQWKAKVLCAFEQW